MESNESDSELISHLLSTSFFVKMVDFYLLLFELQAPSRLRVAHRAPKLVMYSGKFVRLPRPSK
jgi:hypothetical protein